MAVTSGETEPFVERDDELASALATMSIDDRELLGLWAWEGMAPREMAVVLGISANAASIRLHRAKARLAGALVGKNGTVTGHFTGGHPKEEG